MIGPEDFVQKLSESAIIAKIDKSTNIILAIMTDSLSFCKKSYRPIKFYWYYVATFLLIRTLIELVKVNIAFGIIIKTVTLLATTPMNLNVDFIKSCHEKVPIHSTVPNYC